MHACGSMGRCVLSCSRISTNGVAIYESSCRHLSHRVPRSLDMLVDQLDRLIPMLSSPRHSGRDAAIFLPAFPPSIGPVGCVADTIILCERHIGSWYLQSYLPCSSNLVYPHRLHGMLLVLPAPLAPCSSSFICLRVATLQETCCWESAA